MTESDEDVLFADEANEPSAEIPDCGVWKILIVDDEPEVHAITRLVLSDFTFKKRTAHLLSAYSAAEARAVLDQEPDIALILLDVVMETDGAGLAFARHVRETLGNRLVRIILRTGQPGQAPERRVIVDYDINDYKTKTQLTAQQLFTCVVSALRTYEDMVTIEAHRAGLEKIIDVSSTLFRTRSMKLFAVGVLTQLSAIVGRGVSGILCVQRGVSSGGTPCLRVLAGSGRFETLIDDPTGCGIDDPVRQALQGCLEDQGNHYTKGCCTLYIRSPNDRENVVYLQTDQPLTDLDRRLIELFCNRISVGFDNLALIEQTRQAQEGIVAVLAEAAGMWEAVSADLNRNVAMIARGVARQLRNDGVAVAEGFVESLGLAAILHDIGNLRIDREILAKPGPLEDTERALMQAHTGEGVALLQRVRKALGENTVLALAIDIAQHHHENWDGSGYPDGLAGEAIPLAARVIAIADVYDAMTRSRPWRAAIAPTEALAQIKEQSGRRFDPQVVKAFLTTVATLPVD